MRPGRSDIAAPEFPTGVEWLGDPPAPLTRLLASGPALVHFFDFAQLNSVRTLPYLREWHRRYAGAGLAVVGVQAPRFDFGAEAEVVAAGLRRLEVAYPVAIDAEREIWLDYGCRGWPSLFLWGRGGVLRWYHFGEGEYLESETAIQEELGSRDGGPELPEPMPPLRATDAAGAKVMPPSAELFPAGEGAALTIDPSSEPLEVEYQAGGAYATLEGRGELGLTLDANPPRRVAVDGAGLYELAGHSRHEGHRLRLKGAVGELRVWSLSFAPGVP